jgi:[ribosomal protein S18]-alanine N-acetyltransferase
MSALTAQDMAALHSDCFTTPRPWSAAEFCDLCDSPLVFALGTAEGFVLGRCIADEAEVLTLAVAPNARRGGLGTRLMQAFLAQAAARGATTAFLEVASDNPAAIGLYTRLGFVQTGLRKGYFQAPNGHRTDAFVLARAIDAAASAKPAPLF